MKLPWILVIVLLILLSLSYIFQSDKPVENNSRYDSLIQITERGELKAKEYAQQRHIDSLKSIKLAERYSDAVKKKDAQIAYYRAHPKVIEIIREVPVIDSAFRAYDTAIIIRDNRIAELSGELYNCQKAASLAQENFDKTMAAQKGATEEVVEENKNLKKKTFKKVLKKVRDLAIAAGIGYVAKEVVDAVK